MTLRKAASLLLVDDDPSLLKLLGMRLTSEGFRVTTAESGAEALRVLHRERIDLGLSDLRMDEMDGMALFAEIQQFQPCMPVIILPAHGSIAMRSIKPSMRRWRSPARRRMKAGAKQLSPAALSCYVCWSKPIWSPSP